MKKTIILTIAGLLSFLLSTAGIYFAMPTIAPALVHETRVHLDSLGLLPIASADGIDTTAAHPATATVPPISDVDVPVRPDTAAQIADDALSPSIAVDQSVAVLSDSLRKMLSSVSNLRRNNDALKERVEDLRQQLDSLIKRHAHVAELGTSLNKLEDRQLGNILAGMEFDVFETLYLQASAREKARLLQHLPPERATMFVRMLMGSSSSVTVDGPPSAPQGDSADEEPSL